MNKPLIAVAADKFGHLLTDFRILAGNPATTLNQSALNRKNEPENEADFMYAFLCIKNHHRIKHEYRPVLGINRGFKRWR